MIIAENHKFTNLQSYSQNLPIHIQKPCQEFRDELISILGGKLFGIYLYGAVAFPEAAATSDIDFHVVVTSGLSQVEKSKLLEIHDRLAIKYPSPREDFDGYYITRTDLQNQDPPKHLLYETIRDESWALHRAHIRAGKVIILFGPDPRNLYLPVSWSELQEALFHELQYVEEHIHEYPHYCILNLCRIIYSVTNRDVVISKTAAGEWAKREFPEWSSFIDLSKKKYRDDITGDEERILISAVDSIYKKAASFIRPLLSDQGRDL